MFYDPPAIDLYAITGRLRITVAKGWALTIVDPKSQEEIERMSAIIQKLRAL